MNAWPQILLTGGAAIGAASLAVPALRRLAVGGVERDWMAGELELDRVHADGSTVQLKSGAYFRVVRLDGLAYDARPAEDVAQLATARAEALGLAGNAGLCCRLFAVKRRRGLASDAEWPTAPLARIGEAEARRFASTFDIHWFLVLQSPSYTRLDEASGLVVAALGRFGPELLAQAETDTGPCPLTSFLHYLVSGIWRRDLPAVSRNLSARDTAVLSITQMHAGDA